MNSTKNSTTDINDDLKFIPLNLKEPFKSKDSSWIPFINIDVETDHMTNNFFLGLPNLQETNTFTTLPNINAMPELPYPLVTPTQSIYDLDNEKNIIDEDELYPSETLEDELYSYNEDVSNPNNTDTRNNLLHLDVLRDFNLSLDEDIKDDIRGCCNNSVNEIFKHIEEDDAGLLDTLKSYGIPYPIAALIIKKIIKVTVNFSNKE